MLAHLPTVNALLNATSLGLLLLGFRAIKAGQRTRHKQRMLGAVAASGAFLVGYLTRLTLTGTHRFPEVGAVKTLYLAILFSHMLLAALVVPLVAALLLFAWRGRFDRHKRLARWVWPLWVYVSATGVVVYLMLYHLAPRLAS